MKGWHCLSFSEAVADVTGGNVKLQRKDYSPAGCIPIIDQGADDIAGYTDQEDAAYSGKFPVVLFGDHTRNVKFADKSFVLGADGVKVLRPRGDLDAKFLYYFLRRTPIPSKGYSRHFKYLRELNISFPSTNEQHRLVAILDEADALRRKRREANEMQNKLPEVLFESMFDRDLTHAWPPVPLGDRLDFLTSGARGWAQYVRPSGRLFLRIQNVKNGRLILDDVAYVDAPENEEATRTATRSGDVLLSITADLGRTCVIPETAPKAHINQHLALLRSSSLNPYFLSSFLSSPAGLKRILEKNRAAVKAALNFTDIRSLIIPEPPRGLQDAFASRLLEIHALHDRAKTTAATLDTLFQTLLERAFDGRLSADHRAGAARETVQEMALLSRR